MARTMAKVMDKHLKNTARVVANDFHKPSEGYKPPKNVGEGAKFKALNKQFMEYITDVMGSGELGTLNQAVAFNISKVQLASNYQYLYIYWVSSNADPEEVASVQDHLNSIAPKLRHALCSQRLVGNVPVMRFVQDKDLFSLLELERVLQKADMGPDRTPTSPESLIAPQALLPTTQNPQNQSTGRPLEMRQDIMDLDHVHLMNLIKSTPRKRLDESSNVPNPVGDYDMQTGKDFHLYLRKHKYGRKEAEANEVQETAKVKIELVDQDVIEDVYEEDTVDEDAWKGEVNPNGKIIK